MTAARRTGKGRIASLQLAARRTALSHSAHTREMRLFFEAEPDHSSTGLFFWGCTSIVQFEGYTHGELLEAPQEARTLAQ